MYRGQAGYQQFNERKETFAGNAYKGIMQIGAFGCTFLSSHINAAPLRAPTNIRSTIRWDYQPDICKARGTPLARTLMLAGLQRDRLLRLRRQLQVPARSIVRAATVMHR